MTGEAWSEVQKHCKENNCAKQNEYIEKAIRFYSGCLDTLRKFRARCVREVKETNGQISFKDVIRKDGSEIPV